MQPTATLADALHQLFTTDLTGVTFPEVDAASLRSHRDAVEAAARALSEAESAVQRASADLAEKKQALAAHAKRALAYVRVYAEERPELRDRLEQLQGTRTAKSESAEPKRRGRPKKESEVLPLVVAPAAE